MWQWSVLFRLLPSLGSAGPVAWRNTRATCVGLCPCRPGHCGEWGGEGQGEEALLLRTGVEVEVNPKEV